MSKTIYLIGEVVSGQTFNDVLAQYNASGEGDDLLMVIHSNGGSVAEGMAIYDWIKGLTKEGVKVTTRATGLCASIASVILCAAPIRQATANTQIHPHNPWAGDFQGDAKAFGDMSQVLADIEMRLERIYSQATGKPVDAISDLLSLDKPMAVSEAFAFGIINEILRDDDISAEAQSKFNELKQSSKIVAKLDLMAETKDQGILAQIKALLNPKASTEVNNLVLMLADGTSITTDSESGVEVGQAVSFTDSGEAVPDGSHELEGGDVIVTADGVITEVISASAEEPVAQVSREEFAALQAELTEIKDSMTLIANSVANAKATVTKAATIPTKDSAAKFKKPDVQASKRTALEDYVNNRKK